MSKMISLDGTFNTRDIGGIINKDGQIVRYGLMIRSDALNQLTNQDVQFFQDYHLKTIVDFRGQKEVLKAPDIPIPNTTIINLSPNAEVANIASGNIVDDKAKIDALLKAVSTQEGKEKLLGQLDHMAQQMRELVNDPYANQQYRQFVDLISDKNNLPILHHCKGGKDRTGFAAMITLFILDVSEKEVKKDYMLTKECMAKRNEKRMNEYRQYTDNEVVLEYLSGLMQTKEIYFDAAIDEMKKLSGSIDQYLVDYLGVTKEKKDKIKNTFLEK